MTESVQHHSTQYYAVIPLTRADAVARMEEGARAKHIEEHMQDRIQQMKKLGVRDEEIGGVSGVTIPRVELHVDEERAIEIHQLIFTQCIGGVLATQPVEESSEDLSQSTEEDESWESDEEEW